MWFSVCSTDSCGKIKSSTARKNFPMIELFDWSCAWVTELEGYEFWGGTVISSTARKNFFGKLISWRFSWLPWECKDANELQDDIEFNESELLTCGRLNFSTASKNLLKKVDFSVTLKRFFVSTLKSSNSVEAERGNEETVNSLKAFNMNSINKTN